MSFKSEIKKAITNNTKYTAVKVWKPEVDSTGLLKDDINGTFTMTIEVNVRKKKKVKNAIPKGTIMQLPMEERTQQVKEQINDRITSRTPKTIKAKLVVNKDRNGFRAIVEHDNSNSTFYPSFPNVSVRVEIVEATPEDFKPLLLTILEEKLKLKGVSIIDNESIIAMTEQFRKDLVSPSPININNNNLVGSLAYNETMYDINGEFLSKMNHNSNFFKIVKIIK